MCFREWSRWPLASQKKGEGRKEGRKEGEREPHTFVQKKRGRGNLWFSRLTDAVDGPARPSSSQPSSLFGRCLPHLWSGWQLNE